MTIPDYLRAVNSLLATGRAREHAYRGDLQQLLQTLLPSTHNVVNEPSQVRGVGNPDFLVRNSNEVAVGYIEAKDIDKDLDDKGFREQFDRYRKGLDNLIITNYLRFDFYQSGQRVHTVSVGELHTDLKSMVFPKEDEFGRFANLIRNFGDYQGEPIRSPKRLAELMAGKARLLQDILSRAVEVDIEVDNDTELRGQFDSFKEVLLHDLDSKQFSDLYAQTLAYGLFAARLHDDSPDSFSRQEAGELIPKSNPFLRQLFGYVAGFNIDSRIQATVDNLAAIFLLADVKALMVGHGKATGQEDPVVHFYETFLAEYDPKLRKQRGVWYTPQPVVDFIVRAVDDLLKSEFGMKDGLADSSKIKIKHKVQTKATSDMRSKMKQVEVEREVHRVQVLDPATGTGTFLATTIKYIFERNFKMIPGAWPDYVEQHLIPRLNGFELLMASYAMAHLKLDLTLRDTGYERELGKRFNVYLTNALEEDHPDTGTLFAGFLSREANEANAIKRDTPVMVVMGNPPYSGISTNKGEWITSLIDDYKYVDGKHFGERKHWLNDDYVKFIRMAEHVIEKNGEGILAFINNHSFLDNPTFRGMRWHLMQTFDDIYIVDLHGNSLKKEVSPDGSKDVNVFDIQAGVSINIMIRRKDKQRDGIGKVYHAELYGERHAKYEWLSSSAICSAPYSLIKPLSPFYFFNPKNYEGRHKYDQGFSISKTFPVNVTGVVTARDSVVIGFSKEELVARMNQFSNLAISDVDTRSWLFPGKKDGKYKAGDTRGWKLASARQSIANFDHAATIAPITYRPLDSRFIYYAQEMVDWGRQDVMGHMTGPNVALISPKINKEESGAFITNFMAGHKTYSAYDSNTIFPLYLYLAGDDLLTKKLVRKRHPNVDFQISSQMGAVLGLRFTDEKEKDSSTFAPIDLLDYIYAVLHDPDYRETYAEFLSIDFPRVPYPDDAQKFWDLVSLGGELRRVHLLEHPLVDEPLVSFHGPGDNTVTRKMTQGNPGWIADDNNSTNGRVYINDQNYFADVPLAAWKCYIGGYQPAQKWLKDRRDRQLSYDDVRHYLRIVKALVETMRLMEELRGKVLAKG